MIVISAIVVALLFGAGVFLVLQADAMRVVAGTILLSNAAILFLLAGPSSPVAAPILPLREKGAVADTVVQALALTAIVIGFAVTAVLLGLTYRLFVARRTLDLDELGRAEKRDRDDATEDGDWC